MISPLVIVGILVLACPSLSLHEEDANTKCQNDPLCYWWMAQDSPFKRASIKGAHDKNSASFNTGINPNNPFLNGQFEKGPSNAGFNNQGEKVDLNKNPFFNNEKPLFPTAHPVIVVPNGENNNINNNNNENKPDFSKNPFFGDMFTANGTQVPRDKGFIGVQPKPFSTSHPLEQKNNQNFGEDDEYTLGASNKQKCLNENYLCVPKNKCSNGVAPDEIPQSLRSPKNEECDLSVNVCCKILNIDVRSKFPESGKSFPQSLIKFDGVPGFSPGLIQVVPVEINNAGEFGSSHLGESTQKPVRDISGSTSNNVFSSTPDYSNYNFGDVRFASTIQGPAYLPPLGGPVPSSSASPELEVPVSTYVPSVPTRPPPRPFKPVYQPSSNNQFVTYTPKPTFVSEYLPPSTPRPYVPPSKPTTPQPPPIYIPPIPSKPPVQPQPSQSFPILRPYTPSYIPPSPQPTTSREYLPPVIPSSSSNVKNQYRPFPTTQKPYTPPPTVRPRPPPTFIPTTNSQYLPPRTPVNVRPYQPSYQPSPSSISPFTSVTYKPTPGYSYQPPSTTPKPQPTEIFTKGYTYNKPTPGYTYPKPTPGYTYPKPTPGYTYPKPTTQKVLIPSSSFNVQSTYKPSTAGYSYPKPSTTPSTTTQRPTPGYSYPKPTPEFKLPSPASSSVSPSLAPRPTTQKSYPTPSYLPPTTTPRPTPGYSYPKPTPTFSYPDRDGAPGSNNNQYIPPPQPEQDGSDTSDTSVKVRPRPEVQPDQSNTRENLVPPAACAAALKCVQEIYCSADGVISPVPVVLTNEQAQSKVPTTVCRDIASGTVGVCCRDPNYKDPWPSANLVNGFDDGQYKEDASIGQYKQSLNDISQFRNDLSRPSRSRLSNNNLAGPNENIYNQESKDSCGTRNVNSSPKGPGPLNTDFAEIPWQAMILRDTNRSLLCGGAIIKRNAILTTAHCVEGIETSDILVKGGEWKLGIDEEPLPFQIVKVSVVLRHPGYKPGSLLNDLAILFLEEKLRPAKNIGTICLPEPNKIPARNCIATGWGKRILQLHAKGAVMRSITVNIMENEQCKETLSNTYQTMLPHYSPNTLCGFSDQDQCKVDYGSALACTNGDNQYFLSGIFAWDTGCKDQNQIGGYVAPDVEWINDSLSKPLKVLKRLKTIQ